MFGNAKWRREQAVRGKRCNNGDMAEWLKALAWKASLFARATQVRILLSPPRTMAGQAKKDGHRRSAVGYNKDMRKHRGSIGSVAEWLKALVLKTSDGKLFVSSNLTASARQVAKRRQGRKDMEEPRGAP